MAYVKNTWATGDVVTAAKLNNMEDGIANNDVFVVTGDDELSETWQSITDALIAHKRVIIYGEIVYPDELEYFEKLIVDTAWEDGQMEPYSVTAYDFTQGATETYTCVNATDHPVKGLV